MADWFWYAAYRAFSRLWVTTRWRPADVAANFAVCCRCRTSADRACDWACYNLPAARCF